jgi:hypothetical protein
MKNVKSTEGTQPGFMQMWWSRSRRSLLTQQREALLGEHQLGLWRSIKESMRYALRAWRERRPQQMTETWDSFVRRKGYSEVDLAEALRGALRTHWSMYLLAGVLVVYSFWLSLNVGVFIGLPHDGERCIAFAVPGKHPVRIGHCTGACSHRAGRGSDGRRCASAWVEAGAGCCDACLSALL